MNYVNVMNYVNEYHEDPSVDTSLDCFFCRIAFAIDDAEKVNGPAMVS